MGLYWLLLGVSNRLRLAGVCFTPQVSVTVCDSLVGCSDLGLEWASKAQPTMKMLDVTRFLSCP